MPRTVPDGPTTLLTKWHRNLKSEDELRLERANSPNRSLRPIVLDSNPFVRPPRGWNKSVRAGVLHAIALANSFWLQVAASRRSNHRGANTLGELSQLRREIELLREQLRIKDARFARVAPHRRPHYTPVERLAILELKAAQGWSLAQTANIFLVAEPTVASWLARLDENRSLLVVVSN